MALLCDKCNKEITTKENNIKCSVCQLIFHLECANVSPQRFYLMEPSRKTTWKCTPCIDKKRLAAVEQGIKSFPSPRSSSVNNVTFRDKQKYKANITIENSFESLTLEDDDDDESAASADILNRSCPLINSGTQAEIEHMQNKISLLEEKLAIAEQEIENLILENGSLKNTVAKYETRVNQLQNICKSTPVNSKTKSKKKRFKLSIT